MVDSIPRHSRCDHYRQVQHYEVELVEYFGKTDYHAFSNVHTRLYFTDGASILAVFRFEAGHNEHDLLLSLGEASTIRAGSWMALVQGSENPYPVQMVNGRPV